VLSRLSIRRTVALLVLSAVLLITVDRDGSLLLDRIGRGFAVVTSPFERAATAVATPVRNAWTGITEADDLRRENEALRDQLERQRGAEIEATALIREYYALLDLNRLESVAQYSNVTARVIGLAPNNFQNTIQIDRGSADGIDVGMTVVGGAGLVGKITQVFENRAIVLLVTDPTYNARAAVFTGDVPPLFDDDDNPENTTVSGRPISDLTTTTTSSTTTTTIVGSSTTLPDPNVATTGPTSSTLQALTTTTRPAVEVARETGFVRGQGVDQPLVLSSIDETIAFNDLGPGSIVKTAGGREDLAPAGIVIGEIDEIVNQTGTRAPLITVTPSTNFDQLIFVSVILYLPAPSGD
jgi:rod shape-determining protein MreC